MKDQAVLDWLLEESQPCVRYLTLTQLLGKTEDDSQVIGAKRQITKRGWAAEVLARQSPQGWWANGESLYRPKYISTNWMLLILSDLGLTRQEPRIRKASELWIRRFAKKDGGFGSERWSKGHLCTTGNTARALVKFGYVDHPDVKRSFDWLVKNQSEKGGWSCFGSGRNLDSWEPMSAFAALPRQKWTRRMSRTVENGAEFFLERELHRQGTKYRPWYRFHYPIHYYYDLLVGLDFMTSLGYGDDIRLGYATDVLRKKRRRDGKWLMDAVQPDVEGGMAEWFKNHPKDRPIPFSLEQAGQPSKMVTLSAMRVLNRLESQRP
ncbi:MAG TPA: prenyltransferase/squalene oxidase repeat-containing protein [archaeon]|nr:prenyltransferase/squalene oxidase repeat-containing protein [archaeon]